MLVDRNIMHMRPSKMRRPNYMSMGSESRASHIPAYRWRPQAGGTTAATLPASTRPLVERVCGLQIFAGLSGGHAAVWVVWRSQVIAKVWVRVTREHLSSLALLVLVLAKGSTLPAALFSSASNKVLSGTARGQQYRVIGWPSKFRNMSPWTIRVSARTRWWFVYWLTSRKRHEAMWSKTICRWSCSYLSLRACVRACKWVWNRSYTIR